MICVTVSIVIFDRINSIDMYLALVYALKLLMQVITPEYSLKSDECYIKY